MGKGNIISNSSPIINLSKAGRLDLLEKLYGKIIIPEAVYDELLVKGHSKNYEEDIRNIMTDRMVEIKEVSNKQLVKSFQRDLDLGESEVIALALEIGVKTIILDEIDARRIARLYNIEVTGFIGILIKAKKEGFIENVKVYLDKAIKEGFWISPTLYKVIIKDLKE